MLAIVSALVSNILSLVPCAVSVENSDDLFLRRRSVYHIPKATIVTEAMEPITIAAIAPLLSEEGGVDGAPLLSEEGVDGEADGPGKQLLTHPEPPGAHKALSWSKLFPTLQ